MSLEHEYRESQYVKGHCYSCGLPKSDPYHIEKSQPPTEMASLREIKQRLAAIEQDINVLKGVGQELLSGQDKLLQSHAALEKQQESLKQEQIFHNRHTSEDWAALRTAIDEVRDVLAQKLEELAKGEEERYLVLDKTFDSSGRILYERMDLLERKLDALKGMLQLRSYEKFHRQPAKPKAQRRRK